jgi:hypothetical protein
MKLRYFRWATLAAFLAVAACDSPLDIDPTSSIPTDEALKTAREVRTAVVGTYEALQASALYSRELTVYPELYADNLEFTGTYTTTDGQVANRNIFATNVAIRNMWRASYAGINRANTVLAALPNVADLTEANHDQYRGEALFLRALNYLNLVRYFGGVPLILEPTMEIGEKDLVARSTQEEVYQQIVADLSDAVILLEGKRPAIGHATQGAAQALLARAYLDEGQWALARELATAVIDGGDYRLTEDYARLFESKNSDEAILELQYSTIDSNSQAFWYFPDDLGGRQGYAPTQDLYDAYEDGDLRRDFSIGINDGELYGKKYFRISGGDDNVFVIRLAEMYLIRAEANARLHAAPADVRADIDLIRARAGLENLSGTIGTEEQLISAILQERRVEFAMEGHRFFDLRRTGRAEQLLEIDANRLLFPIPQGERDVNRNLGQNDGY